MFFRFSPPPEVITLGEAMAYVLSGMYGPVKDNGLRETCRCNTESRDVDVVVQCVVQCSCVDVVVFFHCFCKRTWELEMRSSSSFNCSVLESLRLGSDDMMCHVWHEIRAVFCHNFPNLKLCPCAKVLILDELLQKGYGLGSGWVAQLRLLSLLLMVESTRYVGHSKISCCFQAFHSSLRPTFATLANEFLQQIHTKTEEKDDK